MCAQVNPQCIACRAVATTHCRAAQPDPTSQAGATAMSVNVTAVTRFPIPEIDG
jgi:hypothetical protein